MLSSGAGLPLWLPRSTVGEPPLSVGWPRNLARGAALTRASLSRAAHCKSAPPEALQRWQRDRSNHKMLGSLLDEWRKDPSWGTVVVSERRRVEHLKRYERKVVWRMEQELRTMFTDQEYVDHLMNAKSKNPELVRNNPDAPGKHQWRQYAIFVDEVIDRTNHVNESEWQLAGRPGPLRSTIFA